MKYIHYDAVVLMTGDDIADAVIEYAGALALNDEADTIHVPTVHADGGSSHVTLLVGPSSEMVVEDAPDEVLEPEDEEFVTRLRNAARIVGPRRARHAAEHPPRA